MCRLELQRRAVEGDVITPAVVNWVVLVDSWSAMAAAFSSVPSFFKEVVTPLPEGMIADQGRDPGLAGAAAHHGKGVAWSMGSPLSRPVPWRRVWKSGALRADTRPQVSI